MRFSDVLTREILSLEIFFQVVLQTDLDGLPETFRRVIRDSYRRSPRPLDIVSSESACSRPFVAVSYASCRYLLTIIYFMSVSSCYEFLDSFEQRHVCSFYYNWQRFISFCQRVVL